MLDRTLAPAARTLGQVPTPSYERATLANGLPVVYIPMGTQPVLEIQLVFRTGHAYEEMPGADNLMGKLLTEGTAHKNGMALAQALDDLGAYFNFSGGYEVSSMSMSGLTRTAPALAALLQEIWQTATLPHNEYELLVQRSHQGLLVEQQKTSYQARRLFMQQLYGAAHPYGISLGLPELEALQYEHLTTHYQAHYRTRQCTVLVAGQFDVQKVHTTLNATIGQLTLQGSEPQSRAAHIQMAGQRGHLVHNMPGNMQSTLRVGQVGGRRADADYHAMRLLVTILGGYFGSRLMQNIREEKGYTYGIHAQWTALRHGGHLGIGTDVANEFVPDTLVQIRKEADLLRQHAVSEDELEKVKNYVLGQLLAGQETPFQVAELLKNQLANDLPADDLQQAYTAVQQATPAHLLQLAQQRLQPEVWTSVAAGSLE